MRANEFVKKHGWKAVTNAVNSTSEKETAFFETKNIEEIKGVNGTTVSLDVKVYKVPYLDLKRLIESHELVDIWGYEKSKEIVANAPSDNHFYSWKLGNSGVYDKTVNIGELRKAIADVESCQ